MLVVALEACPQFIAGDRTSLRELLHPAKRDLALRYSLAHATVPKGQKSTAHRLRTSEVYYILQGVGLMHIDGDEAEVKTGNTVYIPPHSVQFIENTGDSDLVFLCIVDPAWQVEDEDVF
jgi:mannose-6-phosphate isomerase-like protein (cupin superfamily)